MKLQLLLTLCVAYASCDRVLVLVDDAATKDTHSVYFQALQDRGHQLSIRTADDSTIALFKYGELIYQHLVVFAPSVEEFGGSVSVQEIAKFVDAGGNVLVAASSNLGTAIRQVAVEFGFEFDEPDTAVIDHFNFDQNLDDGYHTTIVADKNQLLGVQLIVGDAAKLNPVLYKGVALIADRSNRLKLDVLRASSTAYSYNPLNAVDEFPSAIGKSALLIGAVQTRNNARVVFVGSLDLFSNAYFSAKVQKSGESASVASGNQVLATELSKWALKENGVLRVKAVKHHLVGQTEIPTEYTITDDVEYSIDIEELRNGKWQPFAGKDVQLEFVRIDPFVRTTLSNKNGHLSTKFKLPDVYGVFKFKVDYRRVGYTHLFDVQQISVRPLWHTQYERFIRSAFPYYASSFSMMIGVVLFSIVFIHHKEPAKVSVQAKNK